MTGIIIIRAEQARGRRRREKASSSRRRFTAFAGLTLCAFMSFNMVMHNGTETLRTYATLQLRRRQEGVPQTMIPTTVGRPSGRSRTTLIVERLRSLYSRDNAAVEEQTQSSAPPEPKEEASSKRQRRRPSKPTKGARGSQQVPRVVNQEDLIYKGSRAWDSKPIVIPEYKLLFFTVPKVGCTVWKQLFRRMKGVDNWYEIGQDPRNHDVHNPAMNNLTYLDHFSLDEANEIITSPDWTRAIFVRDPMQRFLSGYLDKGMRDDGAFLKRICCGDWQRIEMEACEAASQSIESYFNLTQVCRDPHWALQLDRMSPEQWRHVNFVGRISDAGEQAKALLQRVGAWEKFGATGWGKYKNESIFQSTSNVAHQTGSKSKYDQYFGNKEFENSVRQLYTKDFQLYSAASGGAEDWRQFAARAL